MQILGQFVFVKPIVYNIKALSESKEFTMRILFSNPYHLQQHASHRMRIIGGISGIAAYRRMALPQVVGLVQETFRR